MKFAVLCAIVVAVFSSAASSAEDQQPWKQWSCDELTPNLCDDLQVESGSLVIRSIPVKYWRYSRKETLSEKEAEEKSNVDSTISNPIIVLHGGPSWPHSYLLPLRQLACRGTTTEVIFYDQAGCGESTIQQGESVSPSHHPHLLDPAYYSEEELPALIDHWKLDKYHVLGHSWGTILAQDFALNSKNTTMGSLQSLVLSGPLSDAQSYAAAQWDDKEGNLGSLPPFVQKRIRALEGEKAYDTPEYEAIDNALTTFFTLRTAPAPDCFTASGEGINKDIYVGMQGASEFGVSGVLGDWNVTGRLHEIDIPVLLTHGAFDTMRPSIVKKMEEQLPHSERVLLPHSGHVSMIDDAGMMNDAVADFLHRVERAAGGSDRLGHDFLARGKNENVVDHNLMTWVKVLVAFVAGLVIGRLSGNGHDVGYSQV
mmetsp:Transcript_13837/g.30124  ORF Transcript_13837/g.30124 Transcript_13837/m.30124 type:complete len:426 (-) Transcript_13837:1310-2587(-)|eukprot:CAMPEP_0172304548 /NCGR_PEP_ID=MMETSP1058-20130122/5944_1 /TAXON_ID=83371 /ORGANISM="Detonula confervacea, Strain CCMP 353" /LENGTH=425 /DNA_ID=CAMNT_0013015815 /DNA_START=84 /DNA_END=1361 /DNA_ORIENTATION=+